MTWTFLTDHAHVLVVLARDPRTNVAAIAAETGLTQSTVQGVLRDLEAEGYVERRRRGSATHTLIDRTQPLRHQVERHHPVGRLLDAVESPADVLRDRLAIGN